MKNVCVCIYIYTHAMDAPTLSCFSALAFIGKCMRIYIQVKAKRNCLKKEVLSGLAAL